MRLGDDSEAQWIGQPLLIRLSILGKAEHGCKQSLELQRRPDLGAEVNVLVTHVPESMPRAMGYGHRLAGAEPDVLVIKIDVQLTRDDLKPLLLVRMNMGRRDETARLDIGIEDNPSTSILAARLAKDDPLARHPVDDPVSRMEFDSV